MDSCKSANKKGVISKMWRRCKSLNDMMAKRGGSTKSVPQNKVAPVGWFPIYVGAEKERFVIRTEQVNHPLFQNLLEEVESEYGYGNKGPLMLPCEVGEFVDVMMEMADYCDEGTHSSYPFLSPQRPTLVTSLMC